MTLSELQFERHGRLSVFLGLVRLRALAAQYPGASLPEIERVAAAVSAGYAAADWNTAYQVDPWFNDLDLIEDASSMRRFLDRLLVHDRPLWLVACVGGRSVARNAMPPGVRQCLAFAQVFGTDPDEDAVQWWDRLVAAQREQNDIKLKDHGRQGERLTLHFEVSRLRDLGITEKPRWMALDDEGLGYDVLSYDLDENGNLANRLIEVKACSGTGLEVYLTRGEWRLASEAGEAYRFHVWHLPTQRLEQFTVAEIAPHVPQDQGLGAWQQVRIPLARAGRAKIGGDLPAGAADL